MIDPLSEVVTLLHPTAPFSKLVIASAPWTVRRTDLEQPFYLLVLEGSCHLTIDGPNDGPNDDDTITLDQGDFALIPAARGFATSSLEPPPPREGEMVTTPIAPMPGGARVGDPDGAVDVRMLVGSCVFGSPDAALLVSLLPRWVHVRGEQRLSTLVQMVGEEFRADRPAREIMMARLLEVLFIEALRSSASTASSAGLVRALADTKLAMALRSMHEHPADSWTVAQLAREATLSRSAFFERFSRAVGVAPMEYLLTWRMALAKQMLRQHESPMAEIAERVGYSSVSTFGVAFTRHVGIPPGRYSKVQLADTLR